MRRKISLRVKVYINKYDVQGNSEDVPDEIETKEEWNRYKQELIGRFVSNFGDHFKRGFTNAKGRRYTGLNLDSFGKGTYADNEMNRRLGRVGKTYDKGFGLRDTLTTELRRGNVLIQGEDAVLKELRNFPRPKRWQDKEEEFLKKGMKEDKLTYKQLAQRLMRTEASLKYKKYSLKKSGRW